MKLFGRAGWGSVLIEAQLAWYGLDYALEEVDDLFESGAAREALAAVNPISQIPTPVLADGAVMTESAAITLLLAEVTGRRDLVPPLGDPARGGFLRWLIFLVANIYPTFTYADDPARFIAMPAAEAGFRASVDAYGQRLWRILEGEVAGPWFLGERVSALDIYICAMTRWRPRRAWFARNCAGLHGITERADELAPLAGVWLRNFPAEQGV